MKLAMIVTKITGNEKNDRMRAAEYCRYAAHKGVVPVSPYLAFHKVFTDELGGTVERLLACRLAQQADEIWVFGNEKDKKRKKRMEEACREYGDKARYIDAAEIGEEMLICAMYTEELMERLEEMEGF